jgi:NADH:ubiquinone oxidoreductase subunit F (NADH-binding)
MTSSILSPVLSEYWDEADSWTLDGYLRHDGYQGLRAALSMEPDAVASRTIWWSTPMNPNPVPAKTFR